MAKRTGEPPLLKKLEAKKKNFGSAEAKLTHYYEKLRKEKLAKAKKSYPNDPDAVKSEMDYVEDAFGPEGRGWSKRVKKLATAEKKNKKLRKIYIALWKMGFDEKMLLHQFRIYEMEDHSRGRSKSQIWDERIPRNKIINEMSEILQEIREDENLDKLIESIEVLNEGKVKEKILADPETKEAFIKLRTTLAKTIYEIFQIYNKALWKYDGAVVDWLGRPDDKIWRVNKSPVKRTNRLFDDHIFDQGTKF